MSKIIVTGGAGFIGSHFVNFLLANTTHEVVIIDNLTYAGNMKNENGTNKFINDNFTFINKSICDVTKEDLGDFEYVVNFAAETHVDNSILNGSPFVKTNVEGTFNLIEISRKNKSLKKFIQISTDEVYGDMDEISKYTCAIESFRLKPSSYYSATKASSDMLILSAHRTFGLPYIITRTCNNYGENQHKEKFIPKIIDSLKNNYEIPVYGDGKQVREWIYVGDNVKAIYNILISDEINDIFNIGTEERYENIELLNMISQSLGVNPRYKFVKDRLGHDLRYSLDSTKYEKKFGKIKTISFNEWILKYSKQENLIG